MNLRHVAMSCYCGVLDYKIPEDFADLFGLFVPDLRFMIGREI